MARIDQEKNIAKCLTMALKKVEEAIKHAQLRVEDVADARRLAHLYDAQEILVRERDDAERTQDFRRRIAKALDSGKK